MKLVAVVLTLIGLAACESCGPTASDYLGCAASCANAGGVKSVTFTKCECFGQPDGGNR